MNDENFDKWIKNFKDNRKLKKKSVQTHYTNSLNWIKKTPKIGDRVK